MTFWDQVTPALQRTNGSSRQMGTHENGAWSEHIPEITIDTVSCFFPSSNSKVTMQDGIWTRPCASRCVRVEVTLREVKKKC